MSELLVETSLSLDANDHAHSYTEEGYAGKCNNNDPAGSKRWVCANTVSESILLEASQGPVRYLLKSRLTLAPSAFAICVLYALYFSAHILRTYLIKRSVAFFRGP